MWSNYSDAQRQLVLDQMKTAGVKWVRLDLGWSMLQPNGPGSYDMNWGVPFADRVINMIHADGFQLLVTFWLTPPWANGGAGETALPTKVSDYANALQWAAARYQGKVNAWEVWNEPNEPYSMAGADPAAYAALLRAAYPAAHAGDPSTTVVFGGPSENDAPWIQRAYAAGIHGSFDAMATHPYMGPSNAPPSTPDDGTIYKLTHVAAVHDLMVANGDGDKPIWFTEFGWSSHANTSTMQNWELGVTPQQQGDYLVQTLQLLKQSYPYVTNAFWYESNDENTGTTANNDNYGLLDSSLAPKPAYTELAAYLAANGSTPAPAPNTVPSPGPTPTATPTASPTPTATPTASPTPTATPTPTPTPTIAAHGPKTRPYRSKVTLSAHLGWRVTGAPVAGAPVSMTAQIGSTAWRSMGTLRTDAQGNVALVVRPTQSMTVRFAYAPAGAPAAVATQHLTVTSTITARPSTTRVRHGRSFRFTGRVAPGASRMLVKRELFYGGRWHVVGSTRTTANGVFSFRVHTEEAATLRYRIVVAAARGRAAAATPTLRVRVH